MQHSEDIKLPDYLFIAYNNAIATYPEDSALAKDAFLKSINAQSVATASVDMDNSIIKILEEAIQSRKQAEKVEDNTIIEVLEEAIKTRKQASEIEKQTNKTIKEAKQTLNKTLTGIVKAALTLFDDSMIPPTGNADANTLYQSINPPKITNEEMQKKFQEAKEKFKETEREAKITFEEALKTANRALERAIIKTQDETLREAREKGNRVMDEAVKAESAFDAIYIFYNGKKAEKVDGKYAIPDEQKAQPSNFVDLLGKQAASTNVELQRK